MEEWGERLTQFGLIILIVAIALGVGGTVLSNISGSQLKTATGTTNNLAVSNGTTSSLTDKDLSSIDTVMNASNGMRINKTTTEVIYYIPNLEQGQIKLVTLDAGTSGANTSAVNVTYTANQRSFAYNTTAEGAQGGDQLSSWLPTIATILIAGIVLTLILTAFVYRKENL